ncbi:MAG: valine--pyruvate transaminase [Hahellaceae bacterium]|nr:valine--pyruvate transaminase [Hahellaceae bacterium]MCP5213206.1 valine--pyruvate transaminase [Hahellaceae bacterium]
MQLSRFGKKFTSDAGITSLMDDLGNALASGEDIIMMGGGNPGFLPEVEDAFRRRMQQLVDNPALFRRLVGVYDPPQGELEFVQAITAFLNREYGWSLTDKNVALTNGSQSAFFILFNMLAGESADGTFRRIQLPLIPEYIGYADAGLADDFFSANRPSIELIDDHLFKYHVDFESLAVNTDTAALCVSRPTNPTGNVLTDGEVEGLDLLARKSGVPLIIDGAYGTPFPHLIYGDATPIWNENIVLCLSLSKLGLPAARTGIVVASEEVVKSVSGINAIINLATGSLGAMLALDMVQSGEIKRLSREVIRPVYQQKAERAVALLSQLLVGLPYRIHKPEGAMFLWLWLEGLPVTNRVLYERLKSKSVLVVSGNYFFPGLQGEWSHTNECIRITYSQDDARVEAGIRIIADEIRTLFHQGV